MSAVVAVYFSPLKNFHEVLSVIHTSLLELLVCPETHQALQPCSAEKLAEINAAIEAGSLHTVGGDICDTPLTEALLREDEQVVYPIVKGIPLLLPETGIPLP